jgi:hypothetical protein
MARGKLQFANERLKLRNKAAILDTRARVAEGQQKLKRLREESKQFKARQAVSK